MYYIICPTGNGQWGIHLYYLMGPLGAQLQTLRGVSLGLLAAATWLEKPREASDARHNTKTRHAS